MPPVSPTKRVNPGWAVAPRTEAPPREAPRRELIAPRAAPRGGASAERPPSAAAPRRPPREASLRRSLLGGAASVLRGTSAGGGSMPSGGSASSITTSSLSSRVGSSWPSTRFTLSERRRRASSTSRIFTLSSSPGRTTSAGLSTWCWASSEMWTRPSTPGRIWTKAPKATILVTLPSTTSPSLYSLRTRCHGSSWVCFRPREMRWRSRSMSSTLTRTVSPIETTSDGWLTWLQESSEMWIRPSMPSRSTKAPKSTMFEILPSTTWPGSRRPRICSRTSLRSSSRTARRESTTLLRERLSSITLHSSCWPMNSSRFWTRRMSTSEAGRKPRTPRSRIRPPLTTSITVPVTGLPVSAASSIFRQAFSKRARFLERIRRPSWSSLVRTRASTSSPSSTSSEGLTVLRIESSLEGMTPSDL